MRAVVGWKSLFYQRTKHRAELKLSRHLPNFIISDLFQDFPLVFFFVNWSEILEQESRRVATEKPNKGL